jgi:hypothetical protein
MPGNSHRYTAGQTGNRRPLSWWQTIPAGLRAAFITFWIIIILFGCSGLGIPRMIGNWAVFVAYAIQFVVYILNGVIAGSQADGSRNAATRTTGYAGERAKRPRPNYIINGLVAGFVLGIVLVLIQIILGMAAQSYMPEISLFNDASGSPVIPLLMDLAFATIGGLIGGFIYDKTH